MIEDIVITPLAIVKTYGGDVMHALKKSDPCFVEFGEAYFSQVDFNAVKAWKRHKRMTLNLVVPIGAVKFVFYDDRSNKEGVFQEIIISRKNYCRLTVPPMVWFGFKGLNNKGAVLLNIADIEHDSFEVDKMDSLNIFYDWSKD